MDPPAASPTDDPARLGELVDAIPGVERIRDAAGALPIYLVGGVVRDLLLGRERSDLDVVVEGDAEALARRLGGEAIGYQRFATAKVTLEGLDFDLARARAESYARPGALPEVRPATLHEDLARRDFSINAMAIPLHAEPDLIDPHGGPPRPRQWRDTRPARALVHRRSDPSAPSRPLLGAVLVHGRPRDRASRPRDRPLHGLGGSRRGRAPQTGRRASRPGRLRAARRVGARRASRGLRRADRCRRRAGAARPWRDEVDAVLAVHAAATGRAPGAAGRLRDMLGSARELAAASPSRPSEAVELARGRAGSS